MPLLLWLQNQGADDNPAAFVVSTGTVTGPDRVVPPGPYLQPATVEGLGIVTGPAGPVDPSLHRVVPRTVSGLGHVSGPQVPRFPPAPPVPPGTPGVDSYPITVPGLDAVTAARCSPALNDVGGGTVTTETAVARDQVIGFDVGGARVFTGYAAEVNDSTLYQPAEEAGQNYQVRVVGLLDDWRWSIVGPDRPELGFPTPDVRSFDFTMNGLEADGFSYVASSSRDMIEAALDPSYADAFPLPDQWADGKARWMWAGTPGMAAAGWCVFIAVTPRIVGRHLVEAVCYDAGEVWCNGKLLFRLDTPGQRKAAVVEFSDAFHRFSPRVFNAGGKAGLALSVIPMTGTGLGSAVLNSRSGWQTIAYPDEGAALIRTAGGVLHRLVREARQRGAPAGAWSLAFSEDTDSAGREWPVPAQPFAVNLGQTYLGVLRALAQTDLDFVASPAGRTLYAWRKGEGSGSSVAVPWTPGVDLSSRGTKLVAR